MSKLRVIKQDLEFLNILRDLTEAYEEIAVRKMKNIRDVILQAREFENILKEIFIDVKTSYKTQIEKLNKLETAEKDKKKLAILITPDDRLYGNLGEKVFKKFLENQHKYNEILLIGKLGKNLMQTYKKIIQRRNITFFSFQNIKKQDLAEIFKILIRYNKVDVYHPRFINLVRQEENIDNISGDKTISEWKTLSDSKKIKFLIEPDIEKLFIFFTTEVLQNLFNYTLNESELALLAARIQTMEKAIENIETQQNKIKRNIMILKRLARDKKQLEQLASITLWNL